MATIDLYGCEIHELEEHISNPQITDKNLEYYIKELMKLIEKQKIDDNKESTSSPRSRHSRRTFDNTDAISISSTTSSRAGRRVRNRNKGDNTRKLRDRKSRKIDGDISDRDNIMDINSNISSRQNSNEYEWMSGINDDIYDSSDEDPMLNLDLTDLNDDDYNMLVSGNTNNSTHKKKHKKDKKKKKKDKDKKHKKKKKKHKKKKKRKGDEDYMVSTDSEDILDFDIREYEQRLTNFSTNQLEKEMKSLERQIEEEKHKLDNNTSKIGQDIPSEDENLTNLTIEEIQEKFNKQIQTIKSKSMKNNTEDPSKLYCVCREPYDGTTQMIQCDYCKEWYHLSCIGLSADKLQSVEKLKFKCPICNGANPNDITNHMEKLQGNYYGASFDSPKTTPNPPMMSGPGFYGNGNDEKMQKQNNKYKKLIEELQRRLVQSKSQFKKQAKEMSERLNKAKRDIDEEKKRRIMVEKHMKGAKEKSDSMVKELGDCFQHQKQKEAELVNKLKKLEANKKKYKDSATENKKKMRQLKEDHENRLHELENELIPSLNDKIRKEQNKKREFEQQLKTMSQQNISSQQQLQLNLNNTYTSYRKCQQQLNLKSNELAKIQNLNSQLKHKIDTLHLNAQSNHQQWENIIKIKNDKINQLEKQIQQYGQYTNTHSNSHSPIKQPEPIKIPPTPGYLKFNDLELEELKMCRELCKKLLDANLFQVEHMAARASLTKDLFVSWVTGIGRSPTVINDLNQATMGTLPSLDPHQHLSMNCIRLLLIEIRKQLETISTDGSGQHDTDTITKVKSLLLEFQTASQSYEQKMNEFKIATHSRLIEQCGQQGNVLEMYCVIGTNENNEPKSDWIKVTVCNFDQQANRVLVRKSNDNTMSYAAIDSATLRLPENDDNNNSNNTQQQIIQQSKTNGNTNNNNQNQNNQNQNNQNQNQNNNQNNQNNMATINRSQSVNTNSNVQIQTQQQQTQQYQWNNVLPRANSSPNPRAMGMGIPSMGLPSMGQQMNFGSIPSFPTMAVSAVSASGLPSFDNLTNNNINNRHTISNTINTNNNISINGTNEPIIIDQNDQNNNNNNNNQSNIISTKSSSSSKSSRKRKREDKHSHKSHKKHKKKKHKRDSDSDSDTSSNSDSDSDSDLSSDSESESSSHVSHKKKHHKHHKKKKKKSKKHKKSKHKKSKKHHKKSHKNKKELKEETPKKRKRGRPPKIKDDDDSSVTSLRKRRGTKRQLTHPNIIHTHGHSGHSGHIGLGHTQPIKKRKLNDVLIGNKSDYDVIGGGDSNDKNDSVCRICKHPGDLVCCEGCPSAYHADCIRPRVKQNWLDSFEDWYCPSCAPRLSYIPLKNKSTNDKWPVNKEPLLKDLKEFLNKHLYLERDYSPVFHPTRKNK